MKITICESKQELGRQAAERGIQCIRDAITDRGEANIIVATGASQFEVLEHLVQAQGIHWPAVTAFHLDEYCGMPITHPASFRLYLWKRFVSQLPLPLKAFHYLDGETDPQAECDRVGAIIRQHPIDVAFVGIGENGHMAFNDPPADFNTREPYIVVDLDEACRKQQLGEGWFGSLDEVPTQAMSMSVNQILASKTLIACVPDERKAQAVAETIANDVDVRYPSTCLKKHDAAYVYLDPQSASKLTAEAVEPYAG